MLRIIGISLDLFSQITDMDIDGTRLPHIIITPYFFQQRISGKYPVPVTRQKIEKLKLLQGKLHLTAIHRDYTGRVINHKIIQLQDFLLRLFLLFGGRRRND